MKAKRKTVPNDVRVYTVQEIMMLLGISRVTAYRLVRSKVFYSIRVGTHYRISKKSFYAWLRECGNKGGLAK